MTRLGELVPDWRPASLPGPEVLEGRYARLERLAPRHAAPLFDANRESDAIWDYLPYGPFADPEDYAAWVSAMAALSDPFFYAILDRDSGRWGGVASWLRITPDVGVIEVGHLNFAPCLQGTRAATEAMVLMIRWAFAAGYRRYEWKCNALNLPSRRAGQRLGLSHEGTFRQATITKGRNRDTTWFAAIDKDWPALSAAQDRWLDPANFDAAGRQRESLSALTRPCLVARDPLLG